MNIQQAIQHVIDQQDLNQDQMVSVMRTIMNGDATPAQIGGFLVGLRMKGETVDEITAAAKVMRELATPVNVAGDHIIDTCGTGGDGANTFNISTAVTFVVAAAGGQVAKHGNRSVSSSSGSADVLEAAGVNLQLSAEQVAQCIDQIGVGFMFAPAHHSAMKHAIGPRRELGVRTLFNMLGPLTNPAAAPHQVMGVFDKQWVEPLAQVLKHLGSDHVMIMHAADGLDEISIANETHIAELKDGEVTTYILTPEQFGFSRQSLDDLSVDSAEQSLKMILSVFNNEPGPALDIVLLNAGAAIYAADLANSVDEGIEKAREVISDGSAGKKLHALVELSQQFNP